MLKEAKSPPDAVQQKLRRNKASLNKETSIFINNLINFKKLMNGAPNLFFKEKSKIINPIPADPATIIGSLAGDFQDIVSKSNAIIQEQINYSKNRRQKQISKPLATQQPTGAPVESPKPDLAKQLAASDHALDFYFIKEASNPLTRFFYRLLNPGIGLNTEKARIRKYRISLLNSTLQIYKDLKKMQKTVVGSGPQSIFVASQLLSKVENNYVFLANGLQAFKEQMPQGVTDTGGQIDVSPDLKEESVKPSGDSNITSNNPNVLLAMEAVRDIQANSNNFKGSVGMPVLRTLAAKFHNANTKEKEALVDEFLGAYKQIITQICADKKIPPQSSFADILAMETVSQKPAVVSANDQLQVVAQNFLGKLQHKINPFDKTSAIRLDVYKIAAESRKMADKIMDLLQNGLDPSALGSLVQDLGNNLMKMKTMMNGLNSTIKGQGNQSQFMNMLEHGRLGDNDVNLNPKQKQELSRMLERKQMRDLTKMYSR